MELAVEPESILYIKKVLQYITQGGLGVLGCGILRMLRAP